jgi:ribosomal protein S18 acetylase RimI-like enzyme
MSLHRLREAGMDEAMLGVDSENPNGALGLYEGLGFEIHTRSAAYRRPLDPI